MKKAIVMTLSILFLIGIISQIVMADANSGRVTINKPTTNEYLTGTINSVARINITMNESGSASYSGVNPFNVTVLYFRYRESGSVTWVGIGENRSATSFALVATNESIVGAMGYTKGSFDTKGLSEIKTYILNVTPGNASANWTSTAINFKIDNGVPAVSQTSAFSSSATVSNTAIWTYKANNATSCTIKFGVLSTASATLTSTPEGAETCSYTSTADNAGTHTSVSLLASDGLNETTSTVSGPIYVGNTGDVESSGSFSIGGGGGGSSTSTQSIVQPQATVGPVNIDTDKLKSDFSNNWIIWVIGAVVVILIFKGKGKK